MEMGLHPELAERAAARAGLDRRMVAALDVDQQLGGRGADGGVVVGVQSAAVGHQMGAADQRDLVEQQVDVVGGRALAAMLADAPHLAHRIVRQSLAARLSDHLASRLGQWLAAEDEQRARDVQAVLERRQRDAHPARCGCVEDRRGSGALGLGEPSRHPRDRGGGRRLRPGDRPAMPPAGRQEQLKEQLVPPAEAVQHGYRLREPPGRGLADEHMAHADRQAGRERRGRPPQGQGAPDQVGRLPEERLVAGVVGILGEVDIDARAGAARPAGLNLDVSHAERVVERARANLELEAAAPNRLAALELVQPQIDPGVGQPLQRALQPFAPDQGLEVAQRDPGVAHELAIRAPWIGEDGALDQRHEPVGPRRHVLPQLRSNDLRVDGRAEERAEIAGELAQQADLLTRGWRSRLGHAVRLPWPTVSLSGTAAGRKQVKVSTIGAMSCRAAPAVFVCAVGRRSGLAERCSG